MVNVGPAGSAKLRANVSSNWPWASIIVAIIGKLAAVALSAYKDCTVRAKTSELILAASSAKVVDSEAALANGAMDQGSSTAVNQGPKYVASVGYTGPEGRE